MSCVCFIICHITPSQRFLHILYYHKTVHLYSEYVHILSANDFDHHNVMCDVGSTGNLLLQKPGKPLRPPYTQYKCGRGGGSKAWKFINMSKETRSVKKPF